MKLRPSETLPTVAKCSYCHQDDGKMGACSSCGTLTHEECVKENGKCPTLGCVKPVRVQNYGSFTLTGSFGSFTLTGGTGGSTTGAGGNVQILGGRREGREGHPPTWGMDTDPRDPMNTTEPF